MAKTIDFKWKHGALRASPAHPGMFEIAGVKLEEETPVRLFGALGEVVRDPASGAWLWRKQAHPRDGVHLAECIGEAASVPDHGVLRG